MATIQIQIDDNTKIVADSLFKEYGLNTETAIKIFISTSYKAKKHSFCNRKL